ncbi:hypothetical protein BN871_HI_00050 [Paenibacillus sp. P22]|nr:hypothetical protein BN871_HI_00050 [Paenibacillus sp. P22]
MRLRHPLIPAARCPSRSCCRDGDRSMEPACCGFPMTRSRQPGRAAESGSWRGIRFWRMPTPADSSPVRQPPRVWRFWARGHPRAVLAEAERRKADVLYGAGLYSSVHHDYHVHLLLAEARSGERHRHRDDPGGGTAAGSRLRAPGCIRKPQPLAPGRHHRGHDRRCRPECFRQGQRSSRHLLENRRCSSRHGAAHDGHSAAARHYRAYSPLYHSAQRDDDRQRDGRRGIVPHAADAGIGVLARRDRDAARSRSFPAPGGAGNAEARRPLQHDSDDRRHEDRRPRPASRHDDRHDHCRRGSGGSRPLPDSDRLRLHQLGRGHEHAARRAYLPQAVLGRHRHAGPLRTGRLTPGERIGAGESKAALQGAARGARGARVHQRVHQTLPAYLLRRTP